MKQVTFLYLFGEGIIELFINNGSSPATVDEESCLLVKNPQISYQTCADLPRALEKVERRNLGFAIERQEWPDGELRYVVVGWKAEIMSYKMILEQFADNAEMMAQLKSLHQDGKNETLLVDMVSGKIYPTAGMNYRRE